MAGHATTTASPLNGTVSTTGIAAPANLPAEAAHASEESDSRDPGTAQRASTGNRSLSGSRLDGNSEPYLAPWSLVMYSPEVLHVTVERRENTQRSQRFQICPTTRGRWRIRI